MTSAIPTLVSLPMLGFSNIATRGGSESSSRIDDLEDRVESLHKRMQVIERAVELQTQVLEEIKAKGTIGSQAIPGGSPLAIPVPPPDEAVVTKTLVDDAVKALSEYAAKAGQDNDVPTEQIQKVLEALQEYREFAE